MGHEFIIDLLWLGTMESGCMSRTSCYHQNIRESSSQDVAKKNHHPLPVIRDIWSRHQLYRNNHLLSFLKGQFTVCTKNP